MPIKLRLLSCRKGDVNLLVQSRDCLLDHQRLVVCDVFVEFGATDGIGKSNTLLLEREYQWDGILAEPNPVWHERLRANRRCQISTDCVWSATGETLELLLTDDPEIASLDVVAAKDAHSPSRRTDSRYYVPTISLCDLLLRYKAPRTIDYVSVDVEGAELSVLSTFDFAKWDVQLWSIEHNFGRDRSEIHAIMLRNGYRSVHSEFSLFDGWYTRRQPA